MKGCEGAHGNVIKTPSLLPNTPCPGLTRASFFVATKEDRRVKPGEDEGW
jgi:hypothetical protein